MRSGKGLVIYHFAMAAFDGWTEYEKMSGGNWRAVIEGADWRIEGPAAADAQLRADEAR